MSCPRCGMFLPASPMVWGAEGPRVIEGPVWHECQEPYARGTAERMRDWLAAGQVPVSPRVVARIALGLREPR